MKSIQWALMAALILPFPAFAQQAQILPAFLEQELGTAAAGTALQLTANKTIASVTSEENYKDRIHEQVERDLKGFNSVVRTGMGLSGVAAMGAFYSLLSNVSGGESIASINNTKSVAKLGFTDEDILLGSCAAFWGGGIGTAALGGILYKDNVKVVLNETKADEFSASTARLLGKVLRLSGVKESALKFAIREAIFEKKKQGDTSPLDLFKILAGTKQAGKNIVSPEEVAALTELKQQEEKAGVKVPEEKQKVVFLLAGNAFLNEQLRQGKLKEDEANKVRAQVAANTKIISKISEYRVASGQAKDESEEGAKEGAAN